MLDLAGMLIALLAAVYAAAIILRRITRTVAMLTDRAKQLAWTDWMQRLKESAVYCESL